jgi:molecular chaperone GrpE
MTKPEEAMQKVQSPDSLEDCQTALGEARREVEELRDRYLRTAAEVENVRKWTERDTLARVKETQRNFLRQLLEVIDNLERALAQSTEQGVLYQGLQLTLRQLEQVLARAGLERIPAQPGQSFDPTSHEAVEVRQGNVSQPTVGDIVQPGYSHEGVLLRPARVVVVQPINRPNVED